MLKSLLDLQPHHAVSTAWLVFTGCASGASARVPRPDGSSPLFLSHIKSALITHIAVSAQLCGGRKCGRMDDASKPHSPPLCVSAQGDGDEFKAVPIADVLNVAVPLGTQRPLAAWNP